MTYCETGMKLVSRYAYWWARWVIHPSIIGERRARIAAWRLTRHERHCRLCPRALFIARLREMAYEPDVYSGD